MVPTSPRYQWHGAFLYHRKTHPAFGPQEAALQVFYMPAPKAWLSGQ